MIRPYTLSMLEHSAKNDPTVLADIAAGTINGYIFTIGSDGKADAPALGTNTTTGKQTADLYVAINDLSGDARYTDGLIAIGAKLNAFLLRAWDTQKVIVDEDSLTTAYADITAGTTILYADTYGKLKTNANPTYFSIGFNVLEKIDFGGKNAIVAQIVVS